MEKFVVIDGNSLINRAFYGLPPLRSLSGKPCGAVFGFVNMMLNLTLKEKPKYLVCVFDAGKHTFRHDMYDGYKANRDHMPEDLAVQLPILKNLLKAMGILVVEQPEIEADDLVGSFTRKFDEEFILISGDRDLFQLVNNNTTVWFTQKGISNVLKVDPETLKKEFGIEPYQVIEMKSIMGDSSDCIPGVAGIGKVGAQKLLQQYQNLDNIYAHIDEISGSTKEKLLANKEMAYLSHELATIKVDVELPYSLEDCLFKTPFNKEVYDLMHELDFKSLITRSELFDLTGAELEQTHFEIKEVTTKEINSNADVTEMFDALKNSVAVYEDNLSFTFGVKDVEYVLYKNSALFNENLTKIKEFFESDTEKICFDCKALMHELSFYGIELKNYFDVSIAIYIANEMDAEITLEEAAKLNNLEGVSSCTALFTLKEIYLKKLKENAQFDLYKDIELPLVKVLFEMEKVGIKVNADEIRNLSATYHVELNSLTKQIYDMAGEEFNIKSPKQLETILFEKLGISYKGKKGTSIEVLNAIYNRHPIVPLIVRYRKIAKLISAYLDGMLTCVASDGKIHTTYMQRTTSTGRLSSREPNLQNLPIRDDEGKNLRKMFVSSFEGGSIVSADYNQIELRLIANFSGDKNMIRDYLSNKDVHTATASKIFGVAFDEVTPNMRRVAKTVNFGIIYGISPYGLSQNLGNSPKEAGEFIDRYMQIYPEVKAYGEKQIETARELGYVKTIMGRVRHIPDINSGNHNMRGFAERTAKNMPLQGSASDIIKIAMVRVLNKMQQVNLKSKLILQIHDELIVDCHPGEEQVVKTILKDEMENVVHLTVPLVVEISAGKNLFEAK
ncbi:MAG: DNA polymerase I [Clostridia bacterium]|nr:DNA polymerase I [Clostridia bacterium]